MAFKHLDGNRPGPCLADENADERLTIRSDVDLRQIVESLSHPLVDRKMLGALGLDHIAVIGEGFARQRLEHELHASLPKMRRREMPPSGKMLSFTWLTGPSLAIFSPQNTWILSISSFCSPMSSGQNMARVAME